MGEVRIGSNNPRDAHIIGADGRKIMTPTQSTSFQRNNSGRWGTERGHLSQGQINAALLRALYRERAKAQGRDPDRAGQSGGPTSGPQRFQARPTGPRRFEARQKTPTREVGRSQPALPSQSRSRPRERERSGQSGR